MKITHRIYPDGSRVKCEHLAPIKPRSHRLPSPCHIPWYTREGKSAAFTLAEMKRWKPIRNSTGVIVGVDRAKRKTVTAKQARTALSDLLRYLDGHHNDDGAIKRARQLAA
tara:strand:+ start:1912 stop:2244 length:333 start_codon:yes stop_codon:yes gene_type:complete